METTEYYYNDKNDRIKEVTWHTVVFWQGLADTVAKYVKCGMRINVIGKLANRSWEGQDGQKKYRYEVKAKEIEFDFNRAKIKATEEGASETTEQPENNVQKSQPAKTENSSNPFVVPETDDLPF